jgi:predicted DNA binding protein
MILKLGAENQFLGSLASKSKVSFSGYPLSYWKDRKNLYVVMAGVAIGEEKDKNALFKEIKQLKDVVDFERSKDFAILVTKQPLFSEPVYDPRIIRPNPAVISKDGYHIWDLASFDRKALEKVWSFAQKHLKARLLTFKEEKISNISFTRLLPELTDKQKIAMDLAVDNGYYGFPKSINMEKLAKMMKVSYSTYQAHLKKAESKILPRAYKSYNF